MSTPLMRQYDDIKKQFPDALVLFQVGDFYELFFEDAQRAAAFLGITLTKRGYHNGEPVPLCGVPVHTKDHYITKLVRGGFKVVLVDQVSQAVPGKMVERAVSAVLTPGTLTDAQLLSEKHASYLCAAAEQGSTFGFAFFELLTGELWLTALPASDEKMIEAELARFSPDEVVVKHDASSALISFLQKRAYVLSHASEEHCAALDLLRDHIRPDVMQFITATPVLNTVLEVFCAYLIKNQSRSLEAITDVSLYTGDDYLVMDAATQRNLELIKNLSDGTSAHTLFSVLDGARTSMGSRLIKKWLLRPALKKSIITTRQERVAWFLARRDIAEQFRLLCDEIGDLERVAGRVALRRAQVSDYRHLKKALYAFAGVKSLLAHFSEEIASFNALRELLTRALCDPDERGWIIAVGYDAELDRLRSLSLNGAQALLDYERSEIERTGIGSLKVRHNQVQGYALEVTKANTHLVPADYLLVQTLVNRDRYSTPALKQLELEIVSAEKLVVGREQALFGEIIQRVFVEVPALRKAAACIAELDVLCGFAKNAYEQNLARPELVEDRTLEIVEGKHPVVMQILKHAFISNDIFLHEHERVWIITGPNMGGKSTFMRQVALMTIMAHMGSYVPAKRATIPLCDRIFTRIGASDHVALGKSTFFVEMEETALICHRATEKSLVILDEVGRGTSTHDGMALAQAIVEHIYEKNRSLCLFATHYQELGELSAHSGIKVYQAAVSQTAKGVVLLHKIVPGIAPGSFGLQVARDAHVPSSIIVRAAELVSCFEQHAHEKDRVVPALVYKEEKPVQTEHEILRHLRAVNYHELSPKQAFDLLWHYKELLS